MTQIALARLREYGLLLRLNKPIGILLLLWPTLWGLWLAAEGTPPWPVLWVFVAGVQLDVLDDAITDSPLVDQDGRLSVIVGLGYTFD